MGHVFIKDLKKDDPVDSIYLVREKYFDTAKNGSSYISIELIDKTGMVNAKKWDASKELFDSFSVDDFIHISGKVDMYKKYPQVIVTSLEKSDDVTVDISLYLPSTNKDIEEMFSVFLKKIAKIKNKYLSELLKSVFHDKEIAIRFKRSPAATDFHHPYLGGLLEHTLYCMELAERIIPIYPGIDSDLLVSGIALHDIGKMEEISSDKGFYYTDRGRLVGHIVLGVSLVEKKIGQIADFPEELKNLILHIILSHHGEHEWGSPKRPMCIEAVILHHIDNLDAKINGFRSFVDTYNESTGNWTKYSKMFKEFLYKKNSNEAKE